MLENLLGQVGQIKHHSLLLQETQYLPQQPAYEMTRTALDAVDQSWVPRVGNVQSLDDYCTGLGLLRFAQDNVQNGYKQCDWTDEIEEQNSKHELRRSGC